MPANLLGIQGQQRSVFHCEFVSYCLDSLIVTGCRLMRVAARAYSTTEPDTSQLMDLVHLRSCPRENNPR